MVLNVQLALLVSSAFQVVIEEAMLVQRLQNLLTLQHLGIVFLSQYRIQCLHVCEEM